MQRELEELRRSLEDSEEEVAKLHGMTSALEAKRLEACDRAREEIRALSQHQEEAPRKKIRVYSKIS